MLEIYQKLIANIMHIFLDESYNLRDRSKSQFISINGFKTTETKQIWKHWKIYRRKFISKARIHATDKRFESLREKGLDLVYSMPDTFFITGIQIIQKIPTGKTSHYYKKDKLNFDKVYEDLLKAILDKLHLREYKKVVINIDNRKHKEGFLGKIKFQENILFYLKECYPSTVFCFRILPSSSNILIEIADFISNTFYKRYVGQRVDFLEKMKVKTIKIKNPLK
ncbi:MAG: DUF3800 domain-containing protein [Candidatus Pacebacteria bacterium]|nr:DUF3800 domain-containing protein [Candidatus Paceibacterota bacterium]